MADYDDAPEVDYEPDDEELHRASVKPGTGDSETESEEDEADGPPAPPQKTDESKKTDTSPRKHGGGASSSSKVGLNNESSHDKRENALRAAAALSSSRTERPIRHETAGVYIPPAKRKLLEQQQKEAGDKPAPSTMQSQRTSWEHLKRTINGTINRLSPTTIKPLIHDLFTNANLIRGRGILATSILRASQASPQYANLYAALASVINTKLPEVGELLLTRAILSFRRGYKSKDRNGVSSALSLLGHLFNQGMAQELLSLQILTVLLDGDPTEDSVDVAVGYMCIVGRRLMEVSPAGVHAVMERFRGLLHEGSVGKRGQYRVETVLKIRKGGFVDYPTVEEELDLVEREDQITFEIGLDDEGLKKEERLDTFSYDEEYDDNEKEWAAIRAEILGEDSDEGSESGSGDESSDDENEIPDQELSESSRQQEEKKTVVVQDLTETDLVHLRRTIYLTIMSSATFEECTHKLAKMDIPDGREHELINMIIECCSQERTFLRYYGMISGRFCLLHERWQDAFQQAFATQYNTIHRLETNKLRNVAKLFGHLLHTDAMSWSVLSVIHLNEDETTSSSRIFIKILVQEMAEAMGMGTLKVRFDTDNPDPDDDLSPPKKSNALVPAKGKFDNHQQPSVQTREWFKGMFPKDNARNTRYAINFFTSIGLGPLTDGMREFLKNAPKLILAQAQAMAAKEAKKDDSDASSVISTSSSSTSSFDSSSSSSFSSSSSYTSSSSSSYSSDSRGKGTKNRNRSRDRKRRQSYSSSSVSSRSTASSYSGHKRKKPSKEKRDNRRDDSIPRDVATDNKTSDASTRSVSLSRDRHGRRKRSYSRSNSRSLSRSRSRSPRTKSSRDKSKPDETQHSHHTKRRRTPSYSSSSRSASRSPLSKKSKKRSRRESRERSS
eukprot:scaffold18520_cov62-Cyclotella_meneghiniana.AAC.2